MNSRLTTRNALRMVVFGALFLSGCRAVEHTVPAPTLPPKTPRAATTARFDEVAAQAGLNYEWTIPGKRPLNILQTIGNGCAFLDFNNDGNLDILLVGTRPALFRGDGDGHFTDISRAGGLGNLSGHFLGCAVGDYDNDGFDDVYLSGYGVAVLLHNENGRAFRVATPKVMKPQPWGTSCAWADVDGDGWLDLFVSNYVHFANEPGIPQLCDSHGVKVACGPRFYKPLRGVFYRNVRGDFTLDNTLPVDKTHGRGLAVAFAPLDETGRPTLVLANDEIQGDLLAPQTRNGTLSYSNIGLMSGTAFDRDGNVHAGMGADWGDYDGDGKLDLFVTTFQGENKSLYRNEGHSTFTDTSYLTGIAASSLSNLAFGCKWLDFDNDGWLDIILASGHIEDNVRSIDTSTTYRQKTLLYRNSGGARPTFENVSGGAGAAFARPIVGRGLAVGDYDNDGRTDILVVDSEGKPLLLHNQIRAGHWARIQLQGTRSNRDGQGALLTATIAGRKVVRLCTTGGSYLSASDKRVHFGLGQATRIDSLLVQWPNGHRDTFNNLPDDRTTTLKETAK
ncbi:hypothetical protein IAD21_00358 [Abditibacteriota bacterium]|nr:hypothetical protein IAD21_00358 [Abditibacteriota bacterium]